MKLINIIWLFLGCLNSYAQHLQKSTGIGFHLLSGYHWASNRESMYHLRYDEQGNIIGRTWDYGASMNGIVSGLGLTLYHQNNKNWVSNTLFGNPRSSIEFNVIKLNKTDTFGYNFSLTANTEIRLLKKLKHELAVKIGYGLSYVTETYRGESNFDNRAISMPINFTVESGLQLHKQIDNSLEFNASLTYYHVSNGSLRIPNGGFNMLLLKAGLMKTIKGDFYVLSRPLHLKRKRNLFFTGYVAGAYREQGLFNVIRRYPTATLSNSALVSLNALYSAGIGFDFFYDPTPPLVRNYTIQLNDVKLNQRFYGAVGISNMLYFGKFLMPVGVYRYVFQNRYVKDPLYLRFGLGYFISKNIFTGCFFKGTINKTGKLESDFMEWSLGYRFKY